MARHCFECGELFEVDHSGVSNHMAVDGQIDYDLDADHVPYGEEEDG